jgi:hypothetical protein
MKESESYYNEHARPGCTVCGGIGKGVVWTYPSQNHAALEPCSECFPPGSEITSFNQPKPPPEQLLLK